RCPSLSWMWRVARPGPPCIRGGSSAASSSGNGGTGSCCRSSATAGARPGAGAGRAALCLQQQGLHVTAVEASPGAAEGCRRRGVADVRLGDLNDAPADQPLAGVLLLGNLGLGGSWEGNRWPPARLTELAAPEATPPRASAAWKPAIGSGAIAVART